MKLNDKQQEFLSDKLGDFGNLVGTGSLLSTFFTEKVGWLPFVGGFVICIACYLYAVYLRR
ncbi:MAG: hypothetical protein ONB46_17780 [candidate division KSB1 bacterium]|nr:hypothetical protein [candidate division KSB1 bacterium]